MLFVFVVVSRRSFISRKYRAWLKDALHHRSQYTTLCWTSAIALLINAVILIVAFFMLNETWLVKQGCTFIRNFLVIFHLFYLLLGQLLPK